MRNITVEIKELIDILKKNRKIHKAEFEAADGIYIDTIISSIRKDLTKMKKTGVVKMAWHFESPISFVAEYDTAIGMLEMTTDKTIELSEMDFKKYVQDDWPLSAAAKMINQSYTN